MSEGHRYMLIGLSGRERFRAGCTCGWRSKDIYTNAGLASAAHTGHVEAVDLDEMCKKCNAPWWDHAAYHDEPPADAIEGDFDGTWTGLYCVTERESS